MESIESGKRVLDLVSDRIIRITSGRLVLAALAGYAFLLVLINGRPFGVAALKEALQSRLLARLREQEVLVESESSCALLANRAWVERLIGHE